MGVTVTTNYKCDRCGKEENHEGGSVFNGQGICHTTLDFSTAWDDVKVSEHRTFCLHCAMLIQKDLLVTLGPQKW